MTAHNLAQPGAKGFLSTEAIPGSAMKHITVERSPVLTADSARDLATR
jgi:hypothetical protein